MDQNRQPQRLVGVDAARLSAIVGMFAAHVFSLYEPSGPGAFSPTFTGLIASGRASVLFMVLAGVSMNLMVKSLRRRGVSDPKIYSILVRRALIIAVLGMVIGPLNEAIAVILVHYGLLFLLLPLALKLSRLTLWFVSVAWLIVAPIIWRPLAAAWVGDTLGHNPTFTDLLTPVTLLKDLTVTGYYPLLVWFGFGLLGMALSKQPLAALKTSVWMLAGGGAAATMTLWLGWALALEHSGRWAHTLQVTTVNLRTLLVSGRLPGKNLDPLLVDPAYLWLPTGHSDSLIFTLHAAACAVAVIGAANLLTPHLAFLGRILGGAGRIPLTLYAGHLVILPLMKMIWMPETIWWVLCATTALLGILFALIKSPGPLEYLVRVLSGADHHKSPTA